MYSQPPLSSLWALLRAAAPRSSLSAIAGPAAAPSSAYSTARKLSDTRPSASATVLSSAQEYQLQRHEIVTPCLQLVLQRAHLERSLPYILDTYPVGPYRAQCGCLYEIYRDSIAYRGCGDLHKHALCAGGATTLLQGELLRKDPQRVKALHSHMVCICIPCRASACCFGLQHA